MREKVLVINAFDGDSRAELNAYFDKGWHSDCEIVDRDDDGNILIFYRIISPCPVCDDQGCDTEVDDEDDPEPQTDAEYEAEKQRKLKEFEDWSRKKEEEERKRDEDQQP